MQKFARVFWFLCNLSFLAACGNHSLGVGVQNKAADTPGVTSPTSGTIAAPTGGSTPTPTPSPSSTPTPTPAPDACNGYAGNYVGKCGPNDVSFTVAAVNNICMFTANAWFDDANFDLNAANGPKATLKDKGGGPALNNASVTLDGLNKQFTIKAYNYAGNFPVACHQ